MFSYNLFTNQKKALNSISSARADVDDLVLTVKNYHFHYRLQLVKIMGAS